MDLNEQLRKEEETWSRNLNEMNKTINICKWVIFFSFFVILGFLLGGAFFHIINIIVLLILTISIVYAIQNLPLYFDYEKRLNEVNKEFRQRDLFKSSKSDDYNKNDIIEGSYNKIDIKFSPVEASKKLRNIGYFLRNEKLDFDDYKKFNSNFYRIILDIEEDKKTLGSLVNDYLSFINRHRDHVKKDETNLYHIYNLERYNETTSNDIIYHFDLYPFKDKLVDDLIKNFYPNRLFKEDLKKYLRFFGNTKNKKAVAVLRDFIDYDDTEIQELAIRWIELNKDIDSYFKLKENLTTEKNGKVKIALKNAIKAIKNERGFKEYMIKKAKDYEKAKQIKYAKEIYLELEMWDEAGKIDNISTKISKPRFKEEIEWKEDIEPPLPCPNCDRGMVYVEKYKKWYCKKCNKYIKSVD